MVIIKINYKPSKITNKLINIICKNILNSPLKNKYNKKTKNRKYTLKEIITKIMYVLEKGHVWRSLDSCYNNVYKNFIFLTKNNVFTYTYKELLNKYLKKHKMLRKIISVDTSFILNKYGIDKIKRNKYVKNKNCNKIFVAIDKNNEPIFFDYCEGNINDCKILFKNINNIPFSNIKNTFLLGDKGFCSNIIRETLKNMNVVPIIPTNKRNSKTEINILTDKQKQIYKKRIKIEHLFSLLKKNIRFNLRYEKYILNLYSFTHIYFSKLLI